MYRTAGLWTWPVWWCCRSIEISGRHGNWRFLVEAGELQRTDAVVMKTVFESHYTGDWASKQINLTRTSGPLWSFLLKGCVRVYINHCSRTKTSRLVLSRCNLKTPIQVRNNNHIHVEQKLWQDSEATMQKCKIYALVLLYSCFLSYMIN